MSGDLVIVKSHPDMLRYVDDLQRKNSDSLAFYPSQVFEREYENGRLYLAMLNGAPCGYIYRGAFGPTVRCFQVCIQYDARRRFYGAAIVQVVEADAVAARSSIIALRCGFDLDANDFWRSLGYKCVGVVDGGLRRGRRINLWQKQIGPLLFDLVESEPERGKQSTRLWLRHKETGIVTQFDRGRRMRDYRARAHEGVDNV